jgi:archaellum biogenesis protein FlaJ (TadC family)
MIVIAALVAGALTGAAIARKRGGRPADLIHYGAVYAIAFGLIGVFATIVIDRMT